MRSGHGLGARRRGRRRDRDEGGVPSRLPGALRGERPGGPYRRGMPFAILPEPFEKLPGGAGRLQRPQKRSRAGVAPHPGESAISMEQSLLSHPGAGPGALLHQAVTRHIRMIEPASERLRIAQAARRRDPVAAFSQASQRPAYFRHIGQKVSWLAPRDAIPRAAIQG